MPTLENSTAPKISVVIPTFNYGRFVATAVKSALAQSYPPYEVIVVDDGSSDNTKEVLTPYQKDIDYIYQANQGLSGARNTGISRASGDWIALLDADDEWHAKKSQVQLHSILSWPEISFLGSPRTHYLPENLPENPEVTKLKVTDFLHSTPMGPSSVLVRKECFDTVGLFDQALPVAEDRDMWLRLATRFQGALVKSPCWRYGSHPDQLHRNTKKLLSCNRLIFDRFFANHPEYKQYRRTNSSYLYLDAALSHLTNGERLASLKYILRSVLYLSKPIDRTKKWLRLKLALRALFGDKLFRRMKPAFWK